MRVSVFKNRNGGSHINVKVSAEDMECETVQALKQILNTSEELWCALKDEI